MSEKTLLNSERIMTKRDVAALLHISTRSVERLIAGGQIPYCKINKKIIRFDKGDISRWFEQKKKGLDF